MAQLKATTYVLYYLNSLNFRAEPLRERMVARNYYFFAHFTARKLNLREIFLLKIGSKIRLRETGKKVKHIFCLDKTFSLTITTKRIFILFIYLFFI